jgi:multidrug efflux pump subunit AcrA (membrane-fusion protein)
MMSLKPARSVLVAAMVVGVGGLLVSCSAPAATGPNPATEAVVVQVATVAVGDISSRKDYVANVAAKHQVDLAPVGTGVIESLPVDTGDEIQQGRMIAELRHGTLDAQLQRAQAMLLNAQARLAAVRAEVAPNRIMAQAQVDAAQSRLDQMIDPSQLDLQAAASMVDRAAAELKSARAQYLQLSDPTESQLAAAQGVVAQSESRLSQAQLSTNAVIANLVSTQTPTLWDLLLTSRLDLQASQAVLQNLRQTYDLNLDETDIASAKQTLDQTRSSISNLLSRIESDSRIPQTVSDALWAESSAQSALEDAHARLEELKKPNQNAVALAQSRIDAAQASLDAANAELTLLRMPTKSALASASADLADAQQGLVLAQEQYVRHQIEAAQATVDQAQAEVRLVQQQLTDLQVIAPFDGLVSGRWLSPGAVATPQTPIVTLVSRELVVTLHVEEIRINLLRIGDPVTFTSPALPGSVLEMKVDRVSPSGDSQEHTFSVHLRPTGDVPGLKPGMSGRVSIEARHREAVLVPREALVYRDNQPSVFKLENDRARRLDVVVGLADVANVEILAGILPGDRVVITGHELLTDGALVAAGDP